MKNKLILGLAFVALAVSVSSCKLVDSSEVGIVVDQIGLDKGQPKTSMESGMVFYFPPTQDVFTYSTKIQHKVWTAAIEEDSPVDEHIDVTSADGATFGLDVGINFTLIREKADVVFKRYRIPLDEITNTRIRTIVRKHLLDNAVAFASDSLLQHRNIYEVNVNKTLAAALLAEGFELNNFTVLKMTLPPSYKDAIDRKIKVIQETARIVSETKQAEAQAKQKVAVAQGNYDAALLDAKTKEIMSAPKMLELYNAETNRIWAEKGISPYGQNNVFGTMPTLLRNH